MTPALVLAAGLATRLRPLSRLRAKTALPVAGQTLLERILRWLVAANVRDAVLNLHHLPDTITAVAGDGSHLGLRLRYSWETRVLGSAGGPRRALPLLGDSPFVLVNGDTLTTVDLAGLREAHVRSGAWVTMALTPNTMPDRYGGALMRDDGTITGFVRRGDGTPSFHVVGVQMANAEAFARLEDDRPAESVTGLYPELIREHPGRVRGWVTDTEFFDIGTPGDYLDTCLTLAARDDASPIDPEAHIDPDAIVRESVVWNDAIVEAGARVERSIVTDGVRVPAGTWRDVVIRRATPDLDPNEQRMQGLAVSPLGNSRA
ncbi:MAG: NDP-sugar synthase [Acidimicrobiia bacterium]|nr:NDP-sugar synthase [Acidimicrobiia bacterium]